MIKLLRPRLPTADALLPYLRKIDESNQYVNFGPLVRQLEDRLSERYNGAHVVTTSSCTSGLEIVWEYLWKKYDEKYDSWPNKVLLPALTFPATALAAHRAGFAIDFLDVDPETWTAPSVSGFGVPEGGSPLDAAGAFGEQTVRKGQTAVFSLHATKTLGCGEGGYIVTHDKEKADEYRRMTNFGMKDRVSVGSGTNAKMSEYHAAVALAALDAYDREPWLQLFDWYAKWLPKEAIQQKRPRGVYPMIAVKLPGSIEQVNHMIRYMGNCEIETRRWYYPNLTHHPLFACDPLPITEDLSEHLLGLPWHLWLTEDDVIYVCSCLDSAIMKARSW